MPKPEEPRSDIVELIKFSSPEPRSRRFAAAFRNTLLSIPTSFPKPGICRVYEHQVIMASGGFVAGSSIELSADGPIREPYICYVQGGISFAYIKLVIDRIIKSEWQVK